MCDEWKEYVNDPRTICKYGSKCYQKNPQHTATYKHPPKNMKNYRGKRTHRFSPYSREKQPTNSNNLVDKDRKDNLDPPEETSTNLDQSTKIQDKINVIQEQEEVKNQGNHSSDSRDLNKKDEACSICLPENLSFYNADSNHDVFKELFLVDMPPDFFELYDCLNSNNAFEKALSSVNLEAVGPFDLLLGKLPKLDDRELYLLHWRFFYDPPEFQSVLKKKGKSEYHIGYFRDVPNEKPAFLGSNNSSKDCHISPMAENIFGAVYLYLQNEKKTSPFTAMHCQRLMDNIKKYAEENNYSLEEYNVKKRLSRVVAKTLHGAGIVVPYDKKTQLGYRNLVETDVAIKKLFTRLGAATTQQEKDSILSEIQPIITYASIAVDECDFGTGIEAGIDLFCSGLKELEPAAVSSLTAAYSLLNREAFGKIIKAHMKLRRRGHNMSILSISE